MTTITSTNGKNTITFVVGSCTTAEEGTKPSGEKEENANKNIPSNYGSKLNPQNPKQGQNQLKGTEITVCGE